MKKYGYFVSWLITIIGILFAIFIYSPISFLIFTKLMNLDGETLSAAIVILRIIFFSRFYQQLEITIKVS